MIFYLHYYSYSKNKLKMNHSTFLMEKKVATTPKEEPSPFIYNGILNIQSINEKYKNIESLLASYFEKNNIELCKHPYVRPYYNGNIEEKNKLFFSIPFDNYCSIELFEKECIKLLHLIEHLGELKIKNGYINAIQIFRIEDPIQYKYIIKIKENEKLALSKVIYDRNIYNKMKNFLKNSTVENLDFLNSLK